MAAVGKHWAAVRAGGGRSGESGTESGMETRLWGSVAGKRPGGSAPVDFHGERRPRAGLGAVWSFGGDSQLRYSSWQRYGHFPFSWPP